MHDGLPFLDVATGLHKLLLAREISAAVTSGQSVAAVGPGPVDDVLDQALPMLVDAGLRVVQLEPPHVGTDFAAGFAEAWQRSGRQPRPVAGDGGDTDRLLPGTPGDAFVLLVRGAHALPQDTLGHLDRMVRAWPWVRLVLAGAADVHAILPADEYPSLTQAVSRVVEIPADRAAGAGRAAPRPVQSAATTTGEAKPRRVVSDASRLVAMRETGLRRARKGTVALAVGLAGGVAVAAALMVSAPPLRGALPVIAAPGVAPTGIAAVTSDEGDRIARDPGARVRDPEADAPSASVEPPAPPAEPNRQPEQPAPASDVLAAAERDPDPAPASPPVAPTPPEPERQAPAAAASMPEAPVAARSEPAAQEPPAAPPTEPVVPAAPAPTAPALPAAASAEREPAPPAAATVEPPASTPVETVAPAEPAAPAAPVAAAPTTPADPPAAQAAPAPAVTAVVPPPIIPVPVAPPPTVPAPDAGIPPGNAAAAAPALPAVRKAGLAPDLMATMVRRGQAMLERGDVSAARLLLGRAGEAGSPAAALAMGQTYDAAFLDRKGLVGVRPDPAVAAEWYRRALELGEPRARSQLDALEHGSGAAQE